MSNEVHMTTTYMVVQNEAGESSVGAVPNMAILMVGGTHDGYQMVVNAIDPPPVREMPMVTGLLDRGVSRVPARIMDKSCSVMQRETYRLERVHFGGRVLHLYVHEPMGVFEAVLRLTYNYRPER